MTFNEIKDILRINDFQASDTHIGTALKLLCPEGKKPFRRISEKGERKRIYNFKKRSKNDQVDWQVDHVEDDLPF